MPFEKGGACICSLHAFLPVLFGVCAGIIFGKNDLFWAPYLWKHSTLVVPNMEGSHDMGLSYHFQSIVAALPLYKFWFVVGMLQ